MGLRGEIISVDISDSACQVSSTDTTQEQKSPPGKDSLSQFQTNKCTWLSSQTKHVFGAALSIECGTYKTVKLTLWSEARFWPWISGRRSSKVSIGSLGSSGDVGRLRKSCSAGNGTMQYRQRFDAVTATSNADHSGTSSCRGSGPSFFSRDLDAHSYRALPVVRNTHCLHGRARPCHKKSTFFTE